MRFFIRLLAVACCILTLHAPSADARRIALVIGNADYKIGRLANPVSDAEAMAGALKSQLKFDKVILRKDLKLDVFRDALRELAGEAAGAELGVIFFAGHGIEVRGRNYLIPTDAALASEAAIDLEAIALDTVLRQLDGVTKLRLVILDACRSNPFPAAKRSGTRGLKSVEPDGGTLVAYAAKDGTTADDGKGRHSPFTTALLRRIVTPGLDVRRVFGYVSEDVLAITSRAQEPYLYGRLGGDEVHLIPAATAVVPPQGGGAGETARVCREVEGMSNPATLAVLERLHKGTPPGECVAARLAQLALAAPPVLPQPPKSEPQATAFNPKRAAVPLTAAEERGLKPKDSFKECPDCPEMVVVPAGSFMMGSLPEEADRTYAEGPRRRVTIAQPLAVGKFEVTFSEWDTCVTERGCSYRPKDGWGSGRQPVINVSWGDITKEYLPWLSRKTDKTYRLLTEAEWEYAARAGTTMRYAFGDMINWSHAQFSQDRWGSAGKTMPVGAFKPNAFGLYDMHGNVWEWVQDCWNDNYAGEPPVDGTAWTTGVCGRRVARGGSWYYNVRDLRSAHRVSEPFNSRDNNTGFRVARTL